MKQNFAPHIEILPSSQQRLWEELIDVPEPFILYGGTAIALYLGHRESVDFDFFALESFDPDQLYSDVPFLKDSRVIQKSPNNLTCLVDRGGIIQVSFFGVPKIKPVLSPVAIDSNNVKIASLLDLAGMKAAVVQKRAEAKDYIDIDAIIHHTEIDLPMALSAAKSIYGEGFNPEVTLKALSYYEEGNLENLSQELKDRLAVAIKDVNLGALPDIKSKMNMQENGYTR